jgi:hypothetical protein
MYRIRSPNGPTQGAFPKQSVCEIEIERSAPGTDPPVDSSGVAVLGHVILNDGL